MENEDFFLLRFFPGVFFFLLPLFPLLLGINIAAVQEEQNYRIKFIHNAEVHETDILEDSEIRMLLRCSFFGNVHINPGGCGTHLTIRTSSSGVILTFPMCIFLLKIVFPGRCSLAYQLVTFMQPSISHDAYPKLLHLPTVP